MDDMLFARRRSTLGPLLVCVVLSFVLLVADQRFSGMKLVRRSIDIALLPVYSIMELPALAADWMDDASLSRSDLQQENNTLRAEMLVLQGRLQKYAAVAAENARLRGLMNSNVVVDGRILVCEIVGLDPDPLRRIAYLNKGYADDVYVGQPVLDAFGIMGQVLQVGQYLSRVLLVADPLASVPVVINRTGVRAVVAGYGALDKLNVLYVPPSADVQPGDLLVTSGLGKLFPFGYPVARVTRVNRKSGGDFAAVSAVPVAELDRSSHVLLLFSRPPHPQGAGHD